MDPRPDPSTDGSVDAGSFARGGEAETIARLTAVIAEQAHAFEAQALAFARSQSIFKRASAAARLGLWECDLSDQSLTWSDGVYDLFDIPRDETLDREAMLDLYTPESLSLLEVLRAKAIEKLTGFTLDAKIVSLQGRRRWIRITATVEAEEGVAVRLFGLKQDITDDKLLTEKTRFLAEYDVMTGLANRQSFQTHLDALVKGGAENPALLLVDLDGFKMINDTHGHAAGDACLKAVGERLRAVCNDGERVFRIGGDEFAVFVSADAAETLAARIVETLGRTVEDEGFFLRLGASVGVARFDPAHRGHELFTRADKALYAAKSAGRNTFRVFETPTEGQYAPPPPPTLPPQTCCPPLM